YVMLCGRSPFMTHRPKDDSAFAIMKRIKSGDFKIDAIHESAWKAVGPAGKQIVKGLLTVDPKKRLNLDDLFNSTWIRRSLQSSRYQRNALKPLLTPAILQQHPLVAERSLMMTFNAFHRVTREGGLAHFPPSHPASDGQPRRYKMSSSCSSGFGSLSSQSSLSSLSPTKTNSNPWMYPCQPPPVSSSSQQPLIPTPEPDRSTFSLQNSPRIQDYLNSLALIQQLQQQHCTPSSHPSSISATTPSIAASSLATSLSSSSLSSLSSLPTSHSRMAAEALSGISYQMMPLKSESSGAADGYSVLQSQASVSITPMPMSLPRTLQCGPTTTTSMLSSLMPERQILHQLLQGGPMTRSRKRKLKDEDDEEGEYPDPRDARGEKISVDVASIARASFPSPAPNNNIPSVSITPIHEPTSKKVYSLTTATFAHQNPLNPLSPFLHQTPHASDRVTVKAIPSPLIPVTITLE
ncbi:hypothetical protein TCAL_12857, partial [Tigriopus californicus]